MKVTNLASNLRLREKWNNLIFLQVNWFPRSQRKKRHIFLLRR